MKCLTRALLTLVCIAYAAPSGAAKLNPKWSDIQSMFVDSARAARTFAKFHQAATDSQFPLILLSGGAERDKTFMMYLYLENFREQIEFVTGLFPLFASTPEESRVSARALQHALAADQKHWLANSRKGKSTVLAMTTGGMRNPHSPKFRSLLDYLDGLNKRMREFNVSFPRSPVRLILETRMRASLLTENFEARGIPYRTVEFFGACDWNLQASD